LTDKEIGERIRKLRSYYNLTQENLSELLGISPAHMGLIERGVRGTTIKRYVAISLIFSVTLDYLLSGRGDAPCSIENEYLDHLEPILNEHELNHITNFSKAFSLYRQTPEETDLLFDALHYTLILFNSIKNLKQTNIKL